MSAIDKQQAQQWGATTTNADNGQLSSAVSNAQFPRVIGRPFQQGNRANPKGRPKGSRNKISELLVKAFRDDFAQHGADAIASVRERDPATYLAMVRQLVPREALANVDASYGSSDGRNTDAMSDDEYCAFMDRHFETVPAHVQARREAALQMVQRGEAGSVREAMAMLGADV